MFIGRCVHHNYIIKMWVLIKFILILKSLLVIIANLKLISVFDIFGKIAYAYAYDY
jgi:hypothetical protein